MKINLSNLFRFKKKDEGLHTAEGAYIINDDTSFNALESYKAARTNIMFSLPKSEKGKIILVSSSQPAEGKTTATINIAYTFACTEAKVIVVDCDLRKPRIHRYLKINKDIGMSNILCGFSTLDEAIQKNVMGNLDCIPAGEIPMNSTELLMSDEMTNLLDELADRYDYIFIDTPPIMSVTDAMIIAPKCSGMILVVRQGVSTYDMMDKTIEIVKRSDAKILGFIMNCDENSKNKYYSYKYKNYKGYLYGYRYEYSDRETDKK